MPPPAARPLTERQQAVMERIDRRLSIKVIAQELGVSETRINQHIRALKDIYEAESLGDLVESYRASLPPSEDGHNLDPSGKGYREAVYNKNQVSSGQPNPNGDQRADQGELVMNDVLPLIESAPWLRPDDPLVVPGVLDNENTVMFRLVAIFGIAIGFLAAVVLSVTAAVTISEAMEDGTSVPIESVQPSG